MNTSELIPPPPDRSTQGLLMWRKPKILRHSRGRTFMIAEHGEASSGTAHLFDLLIEAKADPEQVRAGFAVDFDLCADLH